MSKDEMSPVSITHRDNVALVSIDYPPVNALSVWSGRGSPLCWTRQIPTRESAAS